MSSEPGEPADTSLHELSPGQLPDHLDRLFRAAYAFCGSREDAEDLVQETFVRIMQRPRFLRHDEDIGYLLKVLRNTWLNMRRASLRRPQTVQFDESIDFVVDPGADPGVSVVEMRALYAAIHELSPPLRDALVAVDVVGLSYKQAAKALGTRTGTIMSRLHRARSQVGERLEGADGTTSGQHREETTGVERPATERTKSDPRSSER